MKVSLKVIRRLWWQGYRRADLRRANLEDADLRRADLRRANLEDADLRGADLRRADLRRANLRDANLRDADLRDADLEGANLRDADLEGANLRDADLRGANLEVVVSLNHASVCWTAMGERGRRLMCVEIHGKNMFFCGCFMGDETELKEYIDNGSPEYRDSRTRALEILLELMELNKTKENQKQG